MEKLEYKLRRKYKDDSIAKGDEFLRIIEEEQNEDAKEIAKDLIYWCSEDDIEKYMRVNDLLLDDEEYELLKNFDKFSTKSSLQRKLARSFNAVFPISH